MLPSASLVGTPLVAAPTSVDEIDHGGSVICEVFAAGLPLSGAWSRRLDIFPLDFMLAR